MLRHALLLFGLATLVICDEARKNKYVDPFAALDRHISHSLAYHYLWPWSQLIRAAAALDEDSIEEPKIISEPDKFEIVLSVKRFKPEELRIKVKNRYIIVEGKRKVEDEDKHFMANHFVQRFVLPAGSKPEEVTAVLKENGKLSISAPKHELPPPPPEREVPIQVIAPEVKTEKIEAAESSSLKQDEPVTSSPAAESEATTHIGKIRKKELKETAKTTKDNEVTKGGDGNGLDYALIESEE
ncbi:protein lethal(2)essential for life-like [Battus philenor]|uniref:protein lethal(2)essential for life-like n=1 Tax=Battus philenor TaxID=42288 RepID=UPI0035CFFC66